MGTNPPALHRRALADLPAEEVPRDLRPEAADYEAALVAVRDRYADTQRLASYLIGGAISNLHQHIFRARFYEAPSGGKTIASFVKSFLDDEILTVEAAAAP